jgi:hypothetical protein
MGVKHLTYKDIPSEQRQQGAAEARTRIVALLSNPFLTPEQREYFEAQRARIDQWEKGALPEPPPRVPVAHVVEVSEAIELSEKISGSP